MSLYSVCGWTLTLTFTFFFAVIFPVRRKRKILKERWSSKEKTRLPWMRWAAGARWMTLWSWGRRRRRRRKSESTVLLRKHTQGLPGLSSQPLLGQIYSTGCSLAPPAGQNQYGRPICTVQPRGTFESLQQSRGRKNYFSASSYPRNNIINQTLKHTHTHTHTHKRTYSRLPPVSW